jgi:hypothetical protein
MQEKCEISWKIFVKEVSVGGNGKSLITWAATTGANQPVVVLSLPIYHSATALEADL